MQLKEFILVLVLEQGKLFSVVEHDMYNHYDCENFQRYSKHIFNIHKSIIKECSDKLSQRSTLQVFFLQRGMPRYPAVTAARG